jgi:uncharacterized Rossmann fold enzyme
MASMDFETWSPYYESILAEFGYDREGDEGSARCLGALVPSEHLCRPMCLAKRIKGRVTVCAHGPSLESKLHLIDPHDTLISAGPATTVLYENGIRPDVLVTDLDGPIEADVRCNAMGTVAVLHAHGDNLDNILELVPRFEGQVTPTTQSVPIPGVFNFGGFTDGDRAVCLARHFGAREVRLVGFDFEEPRLKPGQDREVKLRKLRWARRIIYDLNPSEVALSTL